MTVIVVENTMGNLTFSGLTFLTLLVGSSAALWSGPGRKLLKCPSSYVKPKCSCQSNGVESSIQCKGITDVQELQEAFNFNWGKTNAFDYFWLENSALPSLPDGVFKEVSFKLFHFMMSNVSNVADNVFQGSENSATEINIYDSNMSDFNFKSLLILPNLKTVFIGKSHVKKVPQNIFSSLPFLETLYLRDNDIAEILPDTFVSLPNLKYLDLAGNKLTEIKNGALNLSPVKDKKKGVSIDLENNQISSIEPQVLAGIATPGYIDVQENKLTSVSEEVFKPLLDTMVKQNAGNTDVWLNLRGNPIDCKNVDWIKQNKGYTEKLLGFRFTCPDVNKPV